MSSFPVPNVGTMTSTGLTQAQVSVIWQNLVLQCLGIAPSSPTDSAAYSQVRVDWPTPGQPAWPITQDVAFIRATEALDRYNTAHEIQPLQLVGNYGGGVYPYGEGGYSGDNTGTTALETTIYTRVWELSFIFYGPNSFVRARQVKACLYQDFVHDALAASNLYLNTVIGTPRRAPELCQNQWWERTDFTAQMNEQVTDTLTKNTIQSVEVQLQSALGIISDVVVEL